MSDLSPAPARRDHGLLCIFGMAFATFALHLIYNGWYGYHQDELYFIACGEHPSFGYVDHAPMIPWLAKLSLTLFGESLRGIRFFPALAGFFTVLFTGLLARRMGGGTFAQALAALAVMIAPVFLRAQNMLAIPAIEPVFWLAGAYLLLRIVQEDNPRLWLAVGAVAGVGLLTKHTMLFFGFGLMVAMLLTPLRKYFKSPWLYAGGAIALLIFLPNLLWQYANGWPTVEFVRNLNAGTMSRISPLEFSVGQVLYLHPFNAPLWITGLVFLLFTAAGKPYRMFALIWVAVFLTLVTVGSKIYYLAPAYPMIMAAGALAFERFGMHRPWFRYAAVSIMLAGGALFAPLSLPIMPLSTTERYITAVTFGAVKNAFELTGDLRAQYGWKEISEEVARVYNALPAEQQEKTLVLARSYAIAGAIDYFGKPLGLPPARSGHMTYWLWGPGAVQPETVILVGFRKEHIESVFGNVEDAGTAGHELANKWYQETPLLIGRAPAKSIEEIWPKLKEWD